MNDLLPTRPDCADDAGSWCATFYQLTNSDAIARSADTIMSTSMRIGLIIVLALVVRFILHRLINRVVQGATSERLTRFASRMPGTPDTDDPRNFQRARTIGSVLRSVSSAVVLVIATIMIVAEFGVDLAPILASAGVVGVAVGFGAQNLVRDFLSGMFMLLEDQYGVGDIVNVGDATGVIEAVGLRITTLRDGNGTVWYVRNGAIQRVGNMSQGYAVAVVDIPLAYTADPTSATELAGVTARARIAKDDISSSVLEDVNTLGVEKVGLEGMTLRLTVKVKPGDQFTVQRAINAAIIEAFDDAKIPRPTAGAAPTPAA